MKYKNRIHNIFESISVNTETSKYDIMGDGMYVDSQRKKVLNDFMEFIQKKLGVQRMPLLHLVNEKHEDMSSACYKPMTNEMKILVGHRAFLDVLRSIAHEVVHCLQKEEDRLLPGSGAKKDDPLADVGVDYEDEANAKAGALIKEFSRTYNGLGQDEIYYL